MSSFESIVVVGASFTGKSTLVDSVNVPTYQDKIVVPRRYVTRPLRPYDSEHENTQVSEDEFNGMVANGTIGLHWQRVLDYGPGNRHLYGFEASDEDDERLKIYSANNSILAVKNASTENVLGTALVIMAHASPEHREENARSVMPEAQRHHHVYLEHRDKLVDPTRSAGFRMINTGEHDETGQRKSILESVVEFHEIVYSVLNGTYGNR